MTGCIKPHCPTIELQIRTSGQLAIKKLARRETTTELRVVGYDSVGNFEIMESKIYQDQVYTISETEGLGLNKVF
jgi:hypothetical protein